MITQRGVDPTGIESSLDEIESGSLLAARMVVKSDNPEIFYVGYAQPGSSEASAVWRIKRLDMSTIEIDVRWADGNTLYDNVWSLREDLSYS